MSSHLQDSLNKLRSEGLDWLDMSVKANRARSHSWLKNMAEHGAWGQAGAGRVGPPTPSEFSGLAQLLGTTEAAIARMVAADFYGVDTSNGYSARVQRMAPSIDALSEADASLIEDLVGRLPK